MLKKLLKSRKGKMFGIFASAALTLGIGTTVFAGTSYMTIQSVSTGEDGPTTYMSYGSVSMSGANSADSNNTLWVELYQNVAGTDDRIGGKELSIASGTNTWSYTNWMDGNYYVHLDPDGPYYKGCIGWGQAKR